MYGTLITHPLIRYPLALTLNPRSCLLRVVSLAHSPEAEEIHPRQEVGPEVDPLVGVKEHAYPPGVCQIRVCYYSSLLCEQVGGIHSPWCHVPATDPAGLNDFGRGPKPRMYSVPIRAEVR